MSEESGPAAWAKLYHPSGALVTLPVPVGKAGSPEFYRVSFTAVSEAIAAGFLVHAPGLEAGEQKEEIGYVLRRSKLNEDKTETPIIDLYLVNDAVKFKVLSVYLNKDEDVAAFEKASGIGLASLKEFPGTAAPERGASRQSDSYIVRVPKPFGVVLIANPKYDEKEAAAVASRGKGEIYGVPKRKFVRWEGVSTPPASTQSQRPASNATQPSPEPDAKAIAEWKKRLAAGPSCGVLNASLKDVNHYINDKPTFREIAALIKQYAESEGFDWDAVNRKYVPPVDQTPDTDPGSIPF